MRLNQPNGPRARAPPGCGSSIEAQSAGVKIIATSTESTIAETIVIENWR